MFPVTHIRTVGVPYSVSYDKQKLCLVLPRLESHPVSTSLSQRKGVIGFQKSVSLNMARFVFVSALFAFATGAVLSPYEKR